MESNTLTIEGVEYDFNSLTAEAQASVSLYQAAQEELLSLLKKADIQRADMITLESKIKELVIDDSSQPNKEANN